MTSVVDREVEAGWKLIDELTVKSDLIPQAYATLGGLERFIGISIIDLSYITGKPVTSLRRDILFADDVSNYVAAIRLSTISGMQEPVINVDLALNVSTALLALLDQGLEEDYEQGIPESELNKPVWWPDNYPANVCDISPLEHDEVFWGRPFDLLEGAQIFEGKLTMSRDNTLPAQLVAGYLGALRQIIDSSKRHAG